jgi:hypothetical protein
MWNIPSPQRLKRIPNLYETEHIPLKDKLIYLHFFIGGCDWYIAEYDGDDIFFGLVILNHDLEMAEWGYISFKELQSIRIQGWLEIDCETEEAWKVTTASQIEKVRIAHGWPKDNEASNTMNKEQELMLKIKAGHFPSFQNLFAEVTSPLSEYFGMDPYPIWEEANKDALE